MTVLVHGAEHGVHCDAVVMKMSMALMAMELMKKSRKGVRSMTMEQMKRSGQGVRSMAMEQMKKSGQGVR